MNNTSEKHKIHFAWFVMTGLGLLAAGSAGSYTVLVGSFLTPVSTDLGIDLSTLSYYFTALIIALALTLPFVGKVLPKMNLPVSLTAISAIEVLAGGLMSIFTKAWMFYVAAIVIGICMAFTCMVPMSIIMDNWFKKKTGFAIGICWSFTSVYLAIMSPVLSKIIESMGWRVSFVVLAVVSGALMLPSTIFLIRYKPSDKGLLPYGYEKTDEEPTAEEVANATEEDSGISLKKMLRSPAFIAVAATLCIIQLTVVMNQLFPTYAVSVGFDATVGGLMVSAAMIFDMILNPIIGATCDRYGSVKAILGWDVISILSFVILIFSTDKGLPYLAIFGAGVNDVMYVICGVGITALAMTAFGSKNFGKIFSYIVALGYIVGSFGMPLMTDIYEKFGSFQAVFITCIILDCVIAVLVIISQQAGKKLHEKAS